MTTAERLVEEFYGGTAEKDWPMWAQEAVTVLERAAAQIPAGHKLVPEKITPAIEAVIKEVAPKWFAPSVWGSILDADSNEEVA